MLVRYKFEIVLGLIFVTVLVLVYAGGVYFGGASVERKQAVEQLERHDQLRKKDERIDRNAPDGSDKPAAIEWLRQYTRP